MAKITHKIGEADWEAIELDARLGVPMADIAAEYGVEEREIAAVAQLEGWGFTGDLKLHMRHYRYQLFVEAYLTNFSLTEAAAAAGYKEGHYPATLLKNPIVKTMLALRMQEMADAQTANRHKVIRELSRIAFCDPAKLFDANGRPLPLPDIDRDTRASIVGVDVQETFEGEEVSVVKKYKLADKKGALDSLGKHFGMFTEKVEVQDTTPAKDTAASDMDAAKRIAFVFAKAVREAQKEQ